ncbi:hypothetical protein EON65_21290 [archaeon]|nr:MAG: hypothetical protein EON65_21290 [archaeon]
MHHRATNHIYNICKISTVEASLRLDAVASAGLGVSRTRMTKDINGGLVLVDGEKTKVASTTVKVAYNHI